MVESTKNEPPDEDPRDARMGRILNDFLDRKRRGEAVSEDDLLADHPEFAEELRECLDLLTDLRPVEDEITDLIERGVLKPSADPRYPAELGAYRISEVLGRGGMGVVLKGYEESLNRTVALKLLRPELAGDQTALQRFAREAKAAAALRHPNIVTIYGVGEQAGTHFFAMEYVDGPTLAEVIRDRGPLPNEMIREIFRQLLAGLAAAHEAGLIHRDIKSSNILLDGLPMPSQDMSTGSAPPADRRHGPADARTFSGETDEPSTLLTKEGLGEVPSSGKTPLNPPLARGEAGTADPGPSDRDPTSPEPSTPPSGASPSPERPRKAQRRAVTANGRTDGGARELAVPPFEYSSFTVKIADFGLARMISSQTRMTMPDSLLGTPEYMSPEQARGDERIDHRTDLYSAGVVLYEMLTGRTPFKADTPSAVIHQIIHVIPPDPRMLNRTADRRLADTALGLMSKRPEDRLAASQQAPLGVGRYRRPFVCVPRGLPRWFALSLIPIGVAVVVAVLSVLSSKRIINVDKHDTNDGVHRRCIWAEYADHTIQDCFIKISPEAGTLRKVKPLESDHDRFVDMIIVCTMQPPRSGCLRAYDTAAKVKWTNSMSDPYDKQWKDISSSQRPWECRDIEVQSLFSDGGQLIVAAVSDPTEYPSRISIVDPKHGDIVSSFWHFGDIDEIIIVPRFFDDNRSAIVAVGVNNKLDGFGDPAPRPYSREAGEDKPRTEFTFVSVLMILDPLGMEGLGPPRNPHLPDLRRAAPYSYAFLDLAPNYEVCADAKQRGHLGDHTPSCTLRNIGAIGNLEYYPGQQSAPFRVSVLVGPPDGKKGEPRRRAHLDLDRKLQLVKVVPTLTDSSCVDEKCWKKYWRVIVQDGEYVD